MFFGVPTVKTWLNFVSVGCDLIGYVANAGVNMEVNMHSFGDSVISDFADLSPKLIGKSHWENTRMLL